MTYRVVPVVVVAALAVLALAFAPAPSAGAHPPVPFCGGCTGGFEAAAADHDVNATVKHSHLELHVHENATMRGVARLDVDQRTADRFDENASLLEAVAVDAFVTPEASGRSRWAGNAVVRDVEDVDATVRERTVTVRFVVPDGAKRGVGGVVYSDLFRRTATDGAIELHANDATVVGPEGTVLVRAPDDWDGNPLVFHRSVDPLHVGYGGYVAWAPSGGVGGAAAESSIWLSEASATYPRIAVSGWPSVALAGALAAGLVAFARRTDRLDAGMDAFARRTDRLDAGGVDRGGVPGSVVLAAGYGAIAVALVGAAWAALVARIAPFGLALLAVVPGALVAAFALAVVAWLDRTSTGARARLQTRFLYGTLALAAIAGVLAVPMPGGVALASAAGGVVLLGALGLATTRGRAPTAAVAVAFAVAPLGLVALPPRANVVGVPSPLAWVVLVALVGLPLFAFGRRRGRTDDSTPAREPVHARGSTTHD